MSEIGSAYVSILPSFKGTGSTLSKQMGAPVASAGKTLGSTFGKLFAVAGGALIAGKVGGFLKDSIAEAREAQVVTARTENVIKTMGNTAGISAAGVAKLATSLSNKTAIDDEAIQSGQNLLLTFGNIRNEAGKGNDIFSQTSGLMVDMSAAMGTDMKSSAIQLGKALNDPIKGVSALSRVGVSFTEQQKTQIKTLVESGRAMQAQKLILGEVKKQFGGAGAAMSTPAERAKVAFGNLKEQIGTALLPTVDRVASFLSDRVVPAVSRFVAQMQSGKGVGGQVAAVFGRVASVLGSVVGFVNQNRTAFAAFGAGVVALNLVMKAHAVSMLVAELGMKGYLLQTKLGAVASKVFAAGQWVVNAALSANPIGLVIAALVGLVAGLVLAYKKSETFRAIVDASFRVIKSVVASVVGWFAKYVPTVFAAVVGAVKAYINIYKTVIVTAFNVVRAAIRVVVDAFTGAGEKISTFVSGGVKQIGRFVSFVASIPGKILDLVGKMVSAGKDFVGGLFRGIMSAARSGMGFIGDLMGAIKSAVNSALHLPLRIDVDKGPFHIHQTVIPALAKGGPVSAGRTYLVGEQGPELFTSSRSGRIIPNHDLSGLSHRGGGGEVTVHLSRETLREMQRMGFDQSRAFGREINSAAARGHRRSAA